MTPQTPATGEGWTVADVLERAADLIEPEGAWTQGGFARNKRGYLVGPNSAEAVCWCMQGAVHKALGYTNENSAPAKFAFNSLPGRADPLVSWSFNDRFTTTKPEAVARLRFAAAVARERGL